MSVLELHQEREKYDRLLDLCQTQVKALEADDFTQFDQIVPEKDALIASFVDAGNVVAADPALGEIVRQIQECDKTAQKLLYRNAGRIMREMTVLQRFKSARFAYRKQPMTPMQQSLGIGPNASRFIDQKT